MNGSRLSLLESFLIDTHERVVLNRQSPKWKNVKSGWTTSTELFDDDTSLFLVVDEVDESASKLSNDLIRIHDWAYQWKTIFNPYRAKSAQEVIFSWKIKNIIYPNNCLSNLPIVKTTSQKHFGLKLDGRFTFNIYKNEKKLVM